MAALQTPYIVPLACPRPHKLGMAVALRRLPGRAWAAHTAPRRKASLEVAPVDARQSIVSRLRPLVQGLVWLQREIVLKAKARLLA